jgi:hypothetical protein
MMRTRDKLAAALREVAKTATQEDAAVYEAFAERAEAGEFDEYGKGAYLDPPEQLHSELMAHGFRGFAARVAGGEFDATREEADEWAASPEGQRMFGRGAS